MALLQTLLFLLLYIQNNAFNPYNMFNDDVNNDLTLNNDTNYALFNADVDANLTQNTMPNDTNDALGAEPGYQLMDMTIRQATLTTMTTMILTMTVCFVDYFGESDTHSPHKNPIPNQDCFVACFSESDTQSSAKVGTLLKSWSELV